MTRIVDCYEVVGHEVVAVAVVDCCRLEFTARVNSHGEVDRSESWLFSPGNLSPTGGTTSGKAWATAQRAAMSLAHEHQQEHIAKGKKREDG